MNALVEQLEDQGHNVFLGQSSTAPDSRWFDIHPKLGISMIQHLYNRLDGAYPHWFSANFPSAQSLKNWAESWVEAFEQEGITPQAAATGLKTCRARYVKTPSCAEFILACRPEIDPVATYHEAVAGLEARGKGEAGTWSHPAVFWAASLLARELMGQSYSQIKEKWAVALRAQLARTEWAEIPPPRVRLSAPDMAALTREEAAAQLRNLQAAAAFAPKGADSDGLEWARDIKRRQKSGDRALQSIQIKFADEALGRSRDIDPTQP